VTEKQLIISLKQILGSSVDTVVATIAFAWGVVLKTVRRIQKKSFTANGLAVSRKVRFDKGHTLFTSNAKCKQVYTSLYAFKKILRAGHRGEDLTDKELNILWAVASLATKEGARQEALKLLQRASFLIDEIQREIQLTRGRITWRTLIARVRGGSLTSVAGYFSSRHLLLH
jgi:hypothetical protein